jgi:integrase
VVQEWDDEIRAILPPNGLWFAPLSPETGKIDPGVVSIGEHRATLARRSIKEFIDSKGLPYHSPHKFRHGHIQYGLAHSQSIADYKAVSMNLMHSSMEITDEIYSNLNDGEIQNRISGLKKKDQTSENSELELFRQFLEWRKRNLS